MKKLLALLMVGLLGCEPSANSIQTSEATGALQTWLAVPLVWHIDPSSWTIDVLTGGIESSTHVSDPEFNLKDAAIEMTGIPVGSEIVAVFVAVDPGDGHTVMPDNVPNAALFSVDHNGVYTQIMDGAQDASVSPATYDAPHDIVVRSGGNPLPILDPTMRYLIRIENEYGWGSRGAMRVTGAEVVHQ